MADDKSKEVDGRVTLIGVRLSFADIWRPKSIKRNDGTESPPKFSGNFLIDKTLAEKGELKGKYKGKTMPIMAALKAAKTDALAKKMGVEKAKTIKVKAQNYAVKDGNEENYDGYDNQWYVSSNNSKQPGIVGKDKRKLTEADGIPYAGCYVNAVVSLWCQLPGQTPNGDPKPLGVFASLEAIQFVRDGDRFGAAPVDTDEAFDDITDDDDEIGGGGGDDDDDGEDDVL